VESVFRTVYGSTTLRMTKTASREVVCRRAECWKGWR